MEERELLQEMQYQDLLGQKSLPADEKSKFVEKLLEDSKVGRELDDFEIWAGLTKSLKLSFLEPQDEETIMNLFEYSVCLYGIHKPNEFKKIETIQKINQARIITLANIKRAIGTVSPNKKNERIAISTERKESIAIGGESFKPSLLKRLFGLGR